MNTLLVRLRAFDVRVPHVLWRRIVASEAKRSGRRMTGFTVQHHAIRNYTVMQMGRTGGVVTPDDIAAHTDVPEAHVGPILDQLEAAKTFLYRSDGHAVDWAYPITTQSTPHRVRLDTGERLFAA